MTWRWVNSHSSIAQHHYYWWNMDEWVNGRSMTFLFTMKFLFTFWWIAKGGVFPIFIMNCTYFWYKFEKYWPDLLFVNESYPRRRWYWLIHLTRILDTIYRLVRIPFQGTSISTPISKQITWNSKDKTYEIISHSLSLSISLSLSHKSSIFFSRLN